MSDIEGLLGGRVEIDPEKVERGLVKLVLVLIETVHQVIERQAIRRVEGGSLTEEEIERLGLTLLRLERRMDELRRIFGLEEEDLTLRLGMPLDEGHPRLDAVETRRE